MSVTTASSTNGRARKSLANQIDRLDLILDGLADNLNEAVTAAVERAVEQAILTALAKAQKFMPAVEVIAPVEHRPSRVMAWLGRVWAGVKSLAVSVAGQATEQVQSAGAVVRSLTARVKLVARMASRLKGVLVTSLAVGLAAGLLAYVAGQVVAAAGSGVGGFLAALGLQVGLWLRRAMGGWRVPLA